MLCDAFVIVFGFLLFLVDILDLNIECVANSNSVHCVLELYIPSYKHSVKIRARYTPKRWVQGKG